MELTFEPGWVAIIALAVVAAIVFVISSLTALRFWLRADLGTDTAPVALRPERHSAGDTDR